MCLHMVPRGQDTLFHVPQMSESHTLEVFLQCEQLYTENKVCDSNSASTHRNH